MDQKDIFGTARRLIEQHGQNAIVEAAMHSDRMLDIGGLRGVALWNRVVRVIEDVNAVNG